ncbi:hypothetical protein [Parasphingorhabdus sp.]|uniref:hypothetical protein n=1 Tax=Parasphingorhabdus sp. TaxID=2709688 RepID=UPI0035937569
MTAATPRVKRASEDFIDWLNLLLAPFWTASKVALSTFRSPIASVYPVCKFSLTDSDEQMLDQKTKTVQQRRTT